MKKISEENIKAVMSVMQKYNVGVQEFIAIQDMFAKLEVIQEQTKEETKTK